ncbi:MAG: HEPN domain-containing protein [Ruminiclostridium sp.]|nr:HEPN domain-containing protein [Ruminiclostridium sp.]
MQSANDFLTLAERDHKACIKMEEDFPDEYAVTAASYHIQQAVEKALKGLILLNGETPEFTRNIAKLSVQCDRIGVALPEQIDDIADTLTLWESTSRYDPFVSFTKNKYETAKTVYNEL